MSELLATLNKLPVQKVESLLLSCPQAKCIVYHHFAPGLYIRESHLPAGTFAVGHVQKFKHWNVFLKGKVRMIYEDGREEILEAPMQFVGQPGRKVGEILEDVVWQNVYSTEERDIEKLEEHFIEKSDQWQKSQLALLCANFSQHIEDRRDYRKVLRLVGIKESQARAESENTLDMIPFPYGCWSVKTGDSAIEGKGLFATADFAAGDLIAPAAIDGKRTPAGRFTNHSLFPNAEMCRLPNGDISLYALRHIEGCSGGFDGEEITIDYRVALNLVGRLRSLPCPV